ncbi:hypothetical protein ES703_115719 [subsurface metagenome]
MHCVVEKLFIQPVKFCCTFFNLGFQESIGILKLLLCMPLSPKCSGKMLDFQWIEGFLEIEEFIRRRHFLGNSLWVYIRKSCYNDNVNSLINLPNLLRRPNSIRSRRHPHIQKDHSKGILLTESLFYLLHHFPSLGAQRKIKCRI